VPGTALSPAPASHGQMLRYVARQPILDAKLKVFAYELLFRDGIDNVFPKVDAEAACRATLDSSLLMGLEVLCDGRRAFLNFTSDALRHGLVNLLPPALAVVEVLESVQPDEEVRKALQEIKKAGYLVAMDDFIAGDAREGIADLADFIKVETKLTTPAGQEEIVKRFGTHSRMLAEKVETQEEFDQARSLGFSLFQGYFFRRPQVLSARDVPANRLTYLRLLQTVSETALDVGELDRLIKSEPAVCYRLLRYMNSPAFGLRSEIHSVRHALTMLGDREMRRWVRLVCMVAAAQDSPSDLLLAALVRARFCELLSSRVPHGDSDLFLMGLLSLLDAMMEVPMSSLLSHIALEQDTKAVLLGEPSPLRPVFDLVLAHEAGQWYAIVGLASSLHLDPEDSAAAYWQAQQWARALSAGA